jgi:hypothetical protein
MANLDLAVDVFVVADPDRVAAAVHDRWRRWWPDLRLTVVQDRAGEGMAWAVTGPVTGSAELWLEAVLDGVVVHWYLRGEVAHGSPERERARQRARWLEAVLALKDELEAGRAPGVKPASPRADE